MKQMNVIHRVSEPHLPNSVYQKPFPMAKEL